MGRGLILLILLALLLAAATFIEKYVSTAAAMTVIYHSPVVILLLAAMVVVLVSTATKRQLFRTCRWGFLLIHGALILMLSGALGTRIWGEEGVMHIREGARTHQMAVKTNRGDVYRNVPFTVQLKKFIVTRYPHSLTPSSFESVVVVDDGEEKRIAVNRYLEIKGYRLFQSSYDPDEKGTVLSVNRDIWGRRTTLLGYLLLATGFILFLGSKHSRLRQLSRNLKEINGITVS